jgi:CRP-like cAMP-binding protein
MTSLVAALDAPAEEIWSTHQGPALRIRRGQTIFHEGDPSDAAYVLVEGEMRMFVSGSDDDQRSTLLLRAPAIFGDRDLLARCAARESAAAVTPARLVIFDRAAFFEAWGEREFADRIARDLAERSALTAVTASLGLAPLVHRVAVMLRDRTGPLPAPELLAEIACTAPKSIARALGELKKAGALIEDRLDEEVLASLDVPDIPTLFHSLRR